MRSVHTPSDGNPVLKSDCPDVERKPLREHAGIHFDSALIDDSETASRFLAIGLIDDTPPRCGGFTLYPRSAHRFYELALQLRREGVRASSPAVAGCVRPCPSSSSTPECAPAL